MDALETMIFECVYANDANRLRSLLEHGVFVDSRDEEGRTPVMIAAIKGHSEAYRVLLEGGANLMLVDNHGNNVHDYNKQFGLCSDENIAAREAHLIKTILTGVIKTKRLE